MILKKIFENILLGFFSSRKNLKKFFILNLFLFLSIFDISKAENTYSKTKNDQIKIEYFESRNELEDYIIDKGDAIS